MLGELNAFLNKKKKTEAKIEQPKEVEIKPNKDLSPTE
jgi:hypothetical protein